MSDKNKSTKHKYVEIECPECGYMKAYKDDCKTLTSYKCMKHSCRHNWFIHKRQTK